MIILVNAMYSIGVVGVGTIGGNLASRIISEGVSDELLIASRNMERLKNYSLDLQDVNACNERDVKITPCSIEDVVERSDLAVVCARADFENIAKEDIRMKGLIPNGLIIRDIAGKFRGYGGNVLMATNPVDVMSRLFYEGADIEPSKIYGNGSNLDTARYKAILSEIYCVPVESIFGQVIGEHGDSRVVLYSSTTVNGENKKLDKEEIEKNLNERSPIIGRSLGRMRHGAVASIINAIKKIKGDENGIVQLSVQYGEAFIGMPLLFDSGSGKVAFPEMDYTETIKFWESKSKLELAYRTFSEGLRWQT
ncbi:MAG TPA: NAD(P)-binding domain-containing protein [Candidatus Nanoarchaeia archaeon]|nr:NAD(P)-binding domain-containing protein [Candidatus Nanoarchaeia archaeon]